MCYLKWFPLVQTVYLHGHIRRVATKNLNLTLAVATKQPADTEALQKCWCVLQTDLCQSLLFFLVKHILFEFTVLLLSCYAVTFRNDHNRLIRTINFKVNQVFFSSGCSCHSTVIFFVAFMQTWHSFSGKTGLTASSMKFRTTITEILFQFWAFLGFFPQLHIGLGIVSISV